MSNSVLVQVENSTCNLMNHLSCSVNSNIKISRLEPTKEITPIKAFHDNVEVVLVLEDIK